MDFSKAFDEIFDTVTLEQFLLSDIVGLLNAKRNANVYNFRCVVCGDSSTNRNKKRGYIYKKNGKYHYHCHNCGYSANLTYFAKVYYPDNWKYALMNSRFEPIRQNDNDKNIQTVKDAPQETTTKPIKTHISYVDLPLYGIYSVLIPSTNEKVEFVRQKIISYMTKRNIPETSLAKLHFTLNYDRSYKKIQDDLGITGDEVINHEPIPRLITLTHDVMNKDIILSISGRDIANKSNKKYVISKCIKEQDLTKLQELSMKVYNLHDVDIDKPVMVVEGQLDSLFLPNAIAIQGGDVNALHELFKHFIPKHCHDNFIVILDNDNIKDTKKRNIKAIKYNLKVFNWQSLRVVNTLKDINEMINSGLITIKTLIVEILRQLRYNQTPDITNTLNLMGVT